MGYWECFYFTYSCCSLFYQRSLVEHLLGGFLELTTALVNQLLLVRLFLRDRGYRASILLSVSALVVQLTLSLLR